MFVLILRALLRTEEGLAKTIDRGSKAHDIYVRKPTPR